jgi:hypothetical protein
MTDVMSFSFENEGNAEFGNGELHSEEESFHLNENDNETEAMIDGGAGDDDTFSGLGDPNFDFNSAVATSVPYPSSILSENLFGADSGYAPFASDPSSGQVLRADHAFTTQPSLTPLQST